ncbi:MAG: hypothetical protein AB7U85_03395 [Alphaproteobacteria bacterium]
MKQNAPNHLSINLDIDTSFKPIKFFDRVPLSKSIKGLFIGLILLIVPIMSYYGSGNSSIITEDIYLEHQASSFFYIFPLVGLIFIIANLSLFFQKKEIFIDHQNVSVKYFGLLSYQTPFVEPIANYLGIRYRSRIFKYGFFVKTHHVIELLHEDTRKTIPLYIGKNTRNIRHRWQKIAQDLSMPAITRISDGYKLLNYNDLEKPLVELVNEGKITHRFNPNEKQPKDIYVKEKKDKTLLVIKNIPRESGAFLVASVIELFCCFIILLAPRVSFISDDSVLVRELLILTTAIMVFALPLLMILRRQALIIYQDKICFICKFPWFYFKNVTFDKNTINAVDVIYREAEDIYFVAMTYKHKTVHLGKGCNVATLRWLNAYIVENIVNRK